MNECLIGFIVIIFSGWVSWYSDIQGEIDEPTYYWAIGTIGGVISAYLMF